MYVTVYFYQANIFDRHIYCVGSLESSPNTPVLEKSSDLEIYLEIAAFGAAEPEVSGAATQPPRGPGAAPRAPPCAAGAAS